MYLFSEERLLILDCHEGIGFADEENMVPAAFTLELFCYLISDHRIHHTFGSHKVTFRLSYLPKFRIAF